MHPAKRTHMPRKISISSNSYLRSPWMITPAVLSLVVIVAVSVVVTGIQTTKPTHAAGTWASGLSGTGSTDGSFAAWRGEPVTAITIWNDATPADMTNQWSLDQYSGMSVDMDDAFGGIPAGGSWQLAASGAYDADWRTAALTARAKRLGKGTLYIRLCP